VASQDVVIFSLEPFPQNLLRVIGRKDARASEKPILIRRLVLPFSINPTTLFRLIFENFLLALSSVRQISALVLGLDPGDLLDQSLKTMLPHWQ
jgi:hypothetical protein